MRGLYIVVTAFFITALAGCGTSSNQNRLEAFIQGHVDKVAPLSTKANLAYWDAATTGKQEKFREREKLELEIRKIYSDSNDFELLKSFKECGQIKDQRLARQLDKLYLGYLQNQIEAELLKSIVELDTRIQERYNNYRGTIDGKEVTMSDIYTLMTTEGNTRKREMAWKASKQVGNVIIDDFLQLVRLRNKAAKKLGFDNYHTMIVFTSEQSVEQLDAIFA